MPNLVPREHLPNALSAQHDHVPGRRGHRARRSAASSSASSASAWAYAFNAVSFLVVIAALLMMRDVSKRRAANAGAEGAPPEQADFTLHAALEGLRFVFRAPLIRSTMLLDFFATFFSSATALLPIYAQDILGVGARGYGWLYAAPAAGAIVDERGHGAGGGRDRPARARAVGAVIGVRPGHDRVRAVAQLLAVVRVPGGDRRHRHGQHGLPESDSPARDAGSPARAHDRRQHGVLHGRSAARRAGGRARGERARAGASVVSGGIGCVAATMWIVASTPALRQYRTAEQPEILPEDTGPAAHAGQPE